METAVQGENRCGIATEDFARVLAEHERRVFAFVLSLVPTRTDAEDVFQNVSVILWQKIGEFRQGSDFAKWAFQIAYFEVLNYRRKKKRDALIFSDDLLGTLAEDFTEPDFLFQARRAALSDCIAKLTSEDRELLAMRYDADVSVPSLSVRLGSPVRSVYRTLERIRRSLLHCIETSIVEKAL